MCECILTIVKLLFEALLAKLNEKKHEVGNDSFAETARICHYSKNFLYSAIYIFMFDSTTLSLQYFPKLQSPKNSIFRTFAAHCRSTFLKAGQCHCINIRRLLQHHGVVKACKYQPKHFLCC